MMLLTIICVGFRSTPDTLLYNRQDSSEILLFNRFSYIRSLLMGRVSKYLVPLQFFKRVPGAPEWFLWCKPMATNLSFKNKYDRQKVINTHFKIIVSPGFFRISFYGVPASVLSPGGIIDVFFSMRLWLN